MFIFSARKLRFPLLSKMRQETSIAREAFSTSGREGFRLEKDALGSVEVPADKLWGAQTQRSRLNFKIGNEERMPEDLIHAMGVVKLAAAKVNLAYKKLDLKIGDAVISAATEVAAGMHDDQFPLVVWQTGSGTQTNMNTNEVIANRALQLLGEEIGTKMFIHPNDHVNLGQSSNDTFPTAMHIAAAVQAIQRLLPSLLKLQNALERCALEFSPIVKIGRTHLQDATPLTLGQEFSGFQFMVQEGIRRIESALPAVMELAQGGTAVGTGINTYKGFAESFAKEVAAITKLPFTTARNKFYALGGISPMAELSGAMAIIASDLLKIANDIRLLSSGPRSGFNEIVLPANEPGSSIMPGKINPTQCEALSMVCTEVLGNNTAVLIASTHGHLQLNVFRPVVIYNVLRSIRLLSDAADSFTDNCVVGIMPNKMAIQHHLSNSLMLVTALVPLIGYDKCARIALYAHEKNISLREANIQLQFLDPALFDENVRPELMIGPSES